MTSKCPQCGKPSIGVCVDCFVEKYPFGLKKRNLKSCRCGRYMFKGMMYTSLAEVLEMYLLPDIVAPPGVDVQRVKVKSVQQGKVLVVNADIDFTYAGRKFTRDHTFGIRPEIYACDTCSKLAGGYYEAILQMRVPGFNKQLDGRMVAKAEKVAGGVDYYVIDNDYAKQLAHDFKENGYYVTISSKLMGKKLGRNLFRVYYAVKSPGFGVGDVVEYDGRLLKVTELGKDVKFTEIESGRRRSVKLTDLEEVEASVKAADLRRVMVNAVRPDGMQVMDLATCEVYDVPLKAGLKQSDEVGAVLFRGRMILL